MISIQLDKPGLYKVQWPTKDSDTLAQTAIFLAYEDSRNAADQLKDPWRTLIQTQYDAAIAAQASAQTGEAARSVAQADYQAKLAQVRNNLTFALNTLKYQHADNLFQLEYRGFDVRETSRGLSVRMPRKDSELIALLATYVAYESTLGAGQLADPPLATMQGLLADLQDLGQNRGSSRTQRTSNVFTRSTAAETLRELLQGAAIALCLLKFNGQVHPDLANWGYLVVAVTPSKEEANGTGEPPEAA